MVANALTETIGEDIIRNSFFMSDLNTLQISVDAKLGSGAFDKINELLDVRKYEKALMIIYNGLP